MRMAAAARHRPGATLFVGNLPFSLGAPALEDTYGSWLPHTGTDGSDVLNDRIEAVDAWPRNGHRGHWGS